MGVEGQEQRETLDNSVKVGRQGCNKGVERRLGIEHCKYDPSDGLKPRKRYGLSISIPRSLTTILVLSFNNRQPVEATLVASNVQ